MWVGDTVPTGLASELRARRLNALSLAPSEALSECSRGPRAIIVPFASEADKALKLLFGPVVEAGALIGLAISDAEDRAAASELVATVKRKYPAAILDISVGGVADAAEECARHDPGPEANTSLAIEGEVPKERSYLALLQRAFSDFRRIEMFSLTGGFSDVYGVWRVRAFHEPTDCAEPFVVKIGPTDVIEPELGATRDFVDEYVPFPNRPPVVYERCARAGTDSILVSMFVDRATRLDEFLALHAPYLAISAIFDGPLRGWRMEPREERLQLGAEYLRYGVLPNSGDVLQPAYEALPQGSSFEAPAILLERAGRTLSVTVRVCRSHGDLQLRNIFVRHTATEVLAIDFAHANVVSHAARDPAALDVSLGFFYGKSEKRLPESRLSELYQPPLLRRRRKFEDASRAAAIAAVRMHAAVDCLNDNEYGFAVGCHLLKFARHGKEDLSLRALAYRLACRLLT